MVDHHQLAMVLVLLLLLVQRVGVGLLAVQLELEYLLLGQLVLVDLQVLELD